MIIIKRFTVEEVESNQFYQMPKFLFKAEFKHLSNDARVLYSLLRDRHQLSIKNKWINSKSEVYMIYTRLEMSNMLGVSDKPILKAVKLLKQYKLIEETRQGMNKPNLLYLNHVDVENTGYVISPYPDTVICPPSKTDCIKTEKKVLHHLSELNNEYVNIYLGLHGYYCEHKHKRVSDINYRYISDCISDISSYIDLDTFNHGACEYMSKLPLGNDGDILAFLKASKRIFDIDIAI